MSNIALQKNLSLGIIPPSCLGTVSLELLFVSVRLMLSQILSGP